MHWALIFTFWYSRKRFYRYTECTNAPASVGLRPRPPSGGCAPYIPAGDTAPRPPCPLARSSGSASAAHRRIAFPRIRANYCIEHRHDALSKRFRRSPQLSAECIGISSLRFLDGCNSMCVRFPTSLKYAYEQVVRVFRRNAASPPHLSPPRRVSPF